METRLAPIEKPSGLLHRIIYSYSRRAFGKVLSSLSVQYSRLPAKFAFWSSKISRFDRKLELPFELNLLIREQVARINVCTFCTDIGRSIAIREQMAEARFEALEHYKTSELFTERDRAALLFAEEMTRNRNASDATFDSLRRNFSEREIAEIVWVIATEHYYNMSNLALNIHSDMLCDIARKKS